MKKTAIAIALIIIVVLLTLFYYGFFAKVTLVEKEIGDFWLLYEKHVGDYKETGQVMNRIYSRLLGEDAIAPSRGFGIYFDDPKKVEKKHLRSIAGCILDGLDEGKINYLKTNYQVKKYSASTSVVAEFPFKGTPSILMGVIKVYPKLTEYMAQHNYPPVPIMEIYDASNGKISYIASVNLDGQVFDDLLE